MDGATFDSVLSAARADAPWAFEHLYRSLRGPVSAYVALRGVPDPDDVTSEVFLQVFRNLGRFEGDADAFRAWVFTIARRRMYDVWRARSRRPALLPLTGAPEFAGGDVQEEALQRLQDEGLASALASLTADQREVVVLRIVADLSLEDVATVTGRSVAAVKSLQHRALNALRAAYSAPPESSTAPTAI